MKFEEIKNKRIKSEEFRNQRTIFDFLDFHATGGGNVRGGRVGGGHLPGESHTLNPKSSTRRPESSTRHPHLPTSNKKLENRNPEIQNPKSKIRNRKPNAETRNPKSELRTPKLKTPDRKPETLTDGRARQLQQPPTLRQDSSDPRETPQGSSSSHSILCVSSHTCILGDT